MLTLCRSVTSRARKFHHKLGHKHSLFSKLQVDQQVKMASSDQKKDRWGLQTLFHFHVRKSQDSRLSDMNINTTSVNWEPSGSLNSPNWIRDFAFNKRHTTCSENFIIRLTFTVDPLSFWVQGCSVLRLKKHTVHAHLTLWWAVCEDYWVVTFVVWRRNNRQDNAELPKFNFMCVVRRFTCQLWFE